MAIKLKQIAGGAQLQTDVTTLKSQMEGLTGIPAKVEGLENRLNTLENTTMPNKINEAKQAAIQAAAADAQSKADTAKQQAIESAAATAQEKADAAKTAAIADAQSKVEAAKTELNGKITEAKNELGGRIDAVDAKFEGKQDKITADTDLNARNLTLTGDLTVNGLTTIIESENVSIKDRLIELNSEKGEVEEVGLKAYVGAEVPAEGLIFKGGKWGVAKITDSQVPSFLVDSEDPNASTETVTEFKALATEEHVTGQIGTVTEKVNTVEGKVDGHIADGEKHVDNAFKDKVNNVVTEVQNARGGKANLGEKINEIVEKINAVDAKAKVELREKFELAAPEESEEPAEVNYNLITVKQNVEATTVTVIVNGVIYTDGLNVEGKTITFNHEQKCGFNLEAGDKVEVRYFQAQA